MHSFARPRPARGLLIGLIALVIITGQATARNSFATVQKDETSGAALSADLLSNSQFVFGPAARQFNLADYLERQGSPLLPDAGVIESWSAYASVNPQVVLALLELDGEQVTYGWRTHLSAGERDRAAGTLVMGLAERFYVHLYQYGERGAASVPAKSLPLVTLQDGSSVQIHPGTSSATFALLDTLGRTLPPVDFAEATNPDGERSFATVWQGLFEESDPLDASVSITPDDLPPADLLQFPFPRGQSWWFNGAHHWSGSGAKYGKPYSSIDFFTSADSCSAPPEGDWAVAAAPGTGYHPSSAKCWYRIDHAGGWTTSYYHLRNMIANGSVSANQALGTIACETCVGGSASGPHVHFSLLYNGAYVDLEGVTLSGWTVHSGNGDYNTGSLERNGVQKRPYASVRNDGVGTGTPTPTVTLTATVITTVTATATGTPSLTLTPGSGETPTPSATPTPRATSATPPSGKLVSPAAGQLVRSCPVRLVAELDRPEEVAEVRFWAAYEGKAHQVGADATGGDSWHTEWDCQDAPDGPVVLSITLVDLSQQAVAGDVGQTSVTLSKNCNVGTYRTAFFANEALADSPTSSWCKSSAVSYDWGSGSPGAGLPGSDRFSARFRGVFQFHQGVYRFSGRSDDGVRVWVDRTLMLDDWRDHDVGFDSYQFTQPLSAGSHEVWLDYYERAGSAGVALAWEKTDINLRRTFLPILLK